MHFVCEKIFVEQLTSFEDIFSLTVLRAIVKFRLLHYYVPWMRLTRILLYYINKIKCMVLVKWNVLCWLRCTVCLCLISGGERRARLATEPGPGRTSPLTSSPIKSPPPSSDYSHSSDASYRGTYTIVLSKYYLNSVLWNENKLTIPYEINVRLLFYPLLKWRYLLCF